MDRFNNFFAALAKMQASAYLLVGGFCTASLYTFLLDAKANIEWLRVVGYAWILTNIGYFIFSKLFYKRYEIGGKESPIANTGMVITDNYFYTKINSDITSTKKMFGYIYVMLRVWTLIGIGFLLFFLPLFWIKKSIDF